MCTFYQNSLYVGYWWIRKDTMEKKTWAILYFPFLEYYHCLCYWLANTGSNTSNKWSDRISWMFVLLRKSMYFFFCIWSTLLFALKVHPLKIASAPLNQQSIVTRFLCTCFESHQTYMHHESTLILCLWVIGHATHEWGSKEQLQRHNGCISFALAHAPLSQWIYSNKSEDKIITNSNKVTIEHQNKSSTLQPHRSHAYEASLQVV